mmetsp:Transcript_12969/g.26242  ORF Transcript_12969/g.26242 Transcript_12969/m.26242 type:complete len:98 (+) Transcript_12969:249-542(+)
MLFWLYTESFKMMNNIITTAGSSSAASNNTSATRGAFESCVYAAMENALEGSTSTPMHNSQARDGTTYAQKLQSLNRLRNNSKNGLLHLFLSMLPNL